MIFKAKNTPAGILIDNKKTEIENLTKQKTNSEGIALIYQEKTIYLPNTIDDIKSIIDSIKTLATLTLTSSLQPNPANTILIENLKVQLDLIKEALK